MSNHIVSSSPNHHSHSPQSATSNHSIGAYIEKVFKKPYSITSLSSSSPPSKWELPSPSSSSSTSSTLSPSPTFPLPIYLSSSSEFEFDSPYSDCDGTDSCDINSTEEWYHHRLAKRKTPRCVLTTEESWLMHKTLCETGFSARAFALLIVAC